MSSTKKEKGGTIKSDVERFFDEWKKAWQSRYKEGSVARLTPVFRRAALDAIKAVGYDELVKRVGVYLADTSSWLEEHAHPSMVFLRQVDRYRTRKGERNGEKGKARITRHEDFDAEEERSRLKDPEYWRNRSGT